MPATAMAVTVIFVPLTPDISVLFGGDFVALIPDNSLPDGLGKPIGPPGRDCSQRSYYGKRRLTKALASLYDMNWRGYL